ncbi:MAG: spore cortex biosynthesis protein YabQ [Clostridia bacterium]|nr:spore cortex biosynthesis protein YabQ [Clostridia bacterium]
MEYLHGISFQVSRFFYSLGFGFLLGILYDVFRIVRLAVSDAKPFVAVMDFLYFFVCGILSFFFVLVTDEGNLRIYTVLGEVLGWMIYYFSFGVLAMRVSAVAVSGIRRLIRLIFRPFAFIFGKIVQLQKKSLKFIKKSSKKQIKNKNTSCKNINV